MNQKSMHAILLSAVLGLCAIGPAMHVHAAATLAEMAQEIPMYDPGSGEYFLAENQSDADELMLEFGYVQITSESFDTHVPDIVRTADDVKAENTAEGDNSQKPQVKESDGTTEDDSVIAADAINASSEDSDAEVSDEELADEQQINHGPYTGYTQEAHTALLSYIETEDTEDDYVEVYASSDSIKLTDKELTELCTENTPFEIRIVGPKENVLYQYSFQTDRTSKVSNDVELKMTAVPTDDVETYLSFHQDQTLEFPVTFSYQTKYANANFDLRDESGKTIAKGRSNENKMIAFKIGETGNYCLVNADLEKIKTEDQKEDVKQQDETCLSRKQSVGLIIGAGCVATLVGVFVIIKKKH